MIIKTHEIDFHSSSINMVQSKTGKNIKHQLLPMLEIPDAGAYGLGVIFTEIVESLKSQ